MGMKAFVALSLLVFISKANSQEIDAASLNAILPAGFTPVCEDGQEPKSASNRGKRQIGQGPPPCFSIIDADADYNGAKCQAEFEGKCSTAKPYVQRGQTAMCIYFPQPQKWFKLTGTYGWCGADNCCDFQPRGNCNAVRPLANFFPLTGASSCAEVDNPAQFAVTGAELMKGKEGEERIICIKNADDQYVEEVVIMEECGAMDCCRFKFRDSADSS